MKRPLLLIVLFCISSFHHLYCQEPSQKLRELFLDGEYFFLSEDYEEALYSYNTLYKRGYSENSNINYRIGQCYLNIPGEKHKSIPYLEKATENMTNKYSEGSFKETKAPYDAQFYLGNAYRINNRLDIAIAAYEKYKALIDPKNASAIKLADKEIESCKLAKGMMKNAVNFKKTILPRPVSTPNRDYFPAVSDDESVLVFNSAQKFYQAVMFCKKVNKKWTNPINITPEIESDGNQFVSSLSFDGSELFLRLEDKFQANLLVSKYENGKWSKSRLLNRHINTKYWEGNACLSKDGLTLYFSSNRPGGSGALDIYKSNRKADGDWEIPVNLGNVINTEYNEDAPFISEDNKRLYFVSQGHNTMGGYDVFYSDLNADGSWGTPVNLGYPVNSTDDELFYCPVRNGKAAYVAGYLKEGYGSQDLFRLEMVPEKEVVETSVKDTLKAEPETNAQAVDTTKIKERVLPEALVKVITAPEVSPEEKAISRSIFFEFNSALLDHDAKRMLDHLGTIMKNLTELTIEFSGNTDAKGSDEYNLKLSERRAQAAKNYMLSKGIKASRITIKGLGKKKFIAINTNPDGSDNAAGRKYNRRVDIQIIQAPEKSIKLEDVKLPDELKLK